MVRIFILQGGQVVNQNNKTVGLPFFLKISLEFTRSAFVSLSITLNGKSGVGALSIILALDCDLTCAVVADFATTSGLSFKVEVVASTTLSVTLELEEGLQDKIKSDIRTNKYFIL